MASPLPPSSASSPSSLPASQRVRLSVPPAIMALSYSEFSRILMTDDMTRRCNAAFQDTPEILCALRYYTFMDTRPRRLEQELDAYTHEQQEVFDILIRKCRFQNRITPPRCRLQTTIPRTPSLTLCYPILIIVIQ